MIKKGGTTGTGAAGAGTAGTGTETRGRKYVFCRNQKEIF